MQSKTTSARILTNSWDEVYPRPIKIGAPTTPSVILSGAPLDPATRMWRLRFDYGLRPSLRRTRGRNRTPQVQPLCGWDLDGAMFSPSATNPSVTALPCHLPLHKGGNCNAAHQFQNYRKPLPSPAGEGGPLAVDEVSLHSKSTSARILTNSWDEVYPRPIKIGAPSTPSVILSGAPLDPAIRMWRLRFGYGLRPSLRMTRGA